MTESAERRPLVSAFRIFDDTLQELSIPGPFDLIPNPSEILHAFGMPTLDDMAESLKARMFSDMITRGPAKLGGLPELPRLF